MSFTADVSSPTDSSVPLTGVVAFYDGTRLIGTATVVNNRATLRTSALTQGNHMIRRLPGGHNHQQSSTGTITKCLRQGAGQPGQAVRLRSNHPGSWPHEAKAQARASKAQGPSSGQDQGPGGSSWITRGDTPISPSPRHRPASPSFDPELPADVAPLIPSRLAGGGAEILRCPA